MSDLDKELKEISIDSGYGTYGRLDDDAIGEIKQAFIDAGWKYDPIERVGYNPEAEAYQDRFPKLMTGQEWYAYLEALAECNCESHINQVCDKCQIIQPFLNAAKKAAGIE